MRTLPSRGWGPWRQEFYSIHSSPRAQAEDVNHEHGLWCNVWANWLSNRVFDRWPNLWRWWANLEPLRRRKIRQLNKWFPHLR